MITFSQLKQGDVIHVLEVTGTFKKTTSYCEGRISYVSAPYEELVTPLAYLLLQPAKKKLVDVTITCDGELKKLTVEDGKSIITDSSIGLTVATEKQSIIDMIKRSYEEYKAKREAVTKYDEEMGKCEIILKTLGYGEDTGEDPKILELRELVNELKSIIKLAGNMLPPVMRTQLPQNMQNAIDEAN